MLGKSSVTLTGLVLIAFAATPVWAPTCGNKCGHQSRRPTNASQLEPPDPCRKFTASAAHARCVARKHPSCAQIFAKPEPERSQILATRRDCHR